MQKIKLKTGVEVEFSEGPIKEGLCVDIEKREIVYYNGDYGESAPPQLKKIIGPIPSATPLGKAQQLYRDAYLRWCYELSHDKNVLMAKSISEYVCNEVLGYMGADRGTEFWQEVKRQIITGSHQTLYTNGYED